MAPQPPGMHPNAILLSARGMWIWFSIRPKLKKKIPGLRIWIVYGGM